jgi:hypothetical protein
MILEKSEIPQELIDECEDLSLKHQKTYFILDNKVSSMIKKVRLRSDVSEKRNIIIDEILDENLFYICSEDDFKELPSRFAYYDTEIKLTNRYKRYEYVVNYIKSIGFEPSQFNIGQEYEQSFIIEIPSKCKLVIRLRPNLFMSFSTQTINDEYLSIKYDGFFNKEKIMSVLQNTHPDMKPYIRETKLNQILNYENR